MQFTDRMTLDGGLRRTSDGYAVASARVAKGGNVQVYLGSELGITDKALVRVYRPADEVFKKDAIASYAGVPIVIDHPKDRVTADSWKDLAVGETGEDVLRDGEFVRVPMMLRDASAIAAVESGKRELSMGYEANLVIDAGTSPTGETYDAFMADFKMNHVAIVDQARGGIELRIGDGALDGGKDREQWGAAPISTADERTSQMADLRKVLVDGLTVETTDAGAQAIDKLQKAVTDAQTKFTDAETAHQTAIAAKDADLAKKDAEIDALKGKVLDAAALDKLVQARGDLIATAKAIVSDVKTDGLSDAEIRKAVVKAKLGDEAIKDKADAYIDARFDILAEDAGKTTDAFREAVRGGIKPVGNVVTDADAAWSKGVDDLNAWRKEA